MTEEQKQAEKELEKTLDTLSEDELDTLSGGKVTDDVKKFFQSEKGKQLMQYAAIAAGTAVVTIPTTIAITAAYVNKKHKKELSSTLIVIPDPQNPQTGYKPI